MQVLKTLFCIYILTLTIACDKETFAPQIENDTLSEYERDSIAWKENVLDRIRTFPDHVHGKIDTLTYNGDSLVNFVWIAWDSTDLALSEEMFQDFFSTIEPFATYKYLFNTFIVYHKLSIGFEYEPNIDENPTIELMKNDTADHFYFAASAVNNGSADQDHRLAYFRRNNLQTMAHELGHLFGLGDEYLDSIKTTFFGIEEFRKLNYPNIDTLDDKTKVKWSHFIGLEGYETVDVFEGAFFHKKGFYRPALNSVMRMNNSSDLEFNAPSRVAIVKRIYELAGLEYSFEEFLKNDRK